MNKIIKPNAIILPPKYPFAAFFPFFAESSGIGFLITKTSPIIISKTEKNIPTASSVYENALPTDAVVL